MYCSPKHFVDVVRKQSSGDELYELCSVVLALVKKYGGLVKLQTFVDHVSSQQQELGNLLHLLRQNDLLDIKHLKEILTLLAPDHHPTFTVHSPKKLDSIATHLAQTFDDVELVYEESDEAELQVHGDGWWYKRSLDRDLDKILH